MVVIPLILLFFSLGQCAQVRRPGLNTNRPQEVESGSQVKFVCASASSSSGGSKEYIFYKDRQIVRPAARDNQYTISNLSEADSGVYECRVFDGSSLSEYSNQRRLIVSAPEAPAAPATPQPEVPTLSSNQPENVGIVSGTHVILTCTSNNGDDDTKMYTFYKDGTVVRSASRDNTYTIGFGVFRQDTGTYECLITTSFLGSTTSSPYSNPYQLAVVDFPQPPTLTPNGEQDVVVHTSITMTCETSTAGSIVYVFFRDNDLVQSSASNTYVIQDFWIYDYGTYTCSAAGPFGSTASADSLKLPSPLDAVEDVLKLVVKFLG